MLTLKCTITTPEKVVLEKEILQVSIPTDNGEITILPNHIPLVGIIKPGTISIKTPEGEEFVAVFGGFFKVDEKGVNLLADSANQVSELDLDKIETAKRKAEEALLNARNKEDVDYAGLTAVLEKEIARLKTLRRYHHSKLHTIDR
jgi:F-type H+-transporting ATPase subunit epsilon